MKKMKIKEVSKKLNISEDTLRYYEKIGLFNVERKNGIREFTEGDIEIISFIKRFKDIGFSLMEIKTLFSMEEEFKDPYHLTNDNILKLKKIGKLIEVKTKELNKKIEEIHLSLKSLEKMSQKISNSIEKGELVNYANVKNRL